MVNNCPFIVSCITQRFAEDCDPIVWLEVVVYANQCFRILVGVFWDDISSIYQLLPDELRKIYKIKLYHDSRNYLEWVSEDEWTLQCILSSLAVKNWHNCLLLLPLSFYYSFFRNSNGYLCFFFGIDYSQIGAIFLTRFSRSVPRFRIGVNFVTTDFLAADVSLSILIFRNSDSTVSFLFYWKKIN